MTRESVKTKAADWLLRRDAGLAPAEQAQLNRWLAEHESHAREFAALQKGWSLLNAPRRHGEGARLKDALHQHRLQSRRRRSVIAVLSAAGLAAALVLGFLQARFAPWNGRLPSSVTVKPDRQVLPDGSTVELNAGAQIAVHFEAARRRVELVRGEALFEVAKNPARPFVVEAGGVEVLAVGTAFSVKRTPEQVHVLVTEGTVAVLRTGASPALAVSPETALVVAGQSASAWARPEPPPDAPIAIRTPSSQEVAEALGWRNKRVELSGTSIAEAASLFNRQNRLKLRVADPRIADYELSGTFWSDDPEGFVRLLEAGLIVESSQEAETLVLRSHPAGVSRAPTPW